MERTSLTPEPDADVFSGHGIEFVMALPSREEWAADLIINLIRYILSEKGHPVDYSHTIACGKSLQIADGQSLTHMIVLKGVDYQWDVRLPSGNVDFLHLFGITAAEAQLIYDADDHVRAAEAVGAAMLQASGDLVTDPRRECLAGNSAFKAAFEDFYARSAPTTE